MEHVYIFIAMSLVSLPMPGPVFRNKLQSEKGDLLANCPNAADLVETILGFSKKSF